MGSAVGVAVNLNLIQSIRLIHAIAESDFAVYVPQAELWRFSELQRKFNLRLISDSTGAITLKEISLNHSTPLTSIGKISRPLIFPHVIFSYCRNSWPAEHMRDIAVSFCGLLTKSRRSVVTSWLANHGLGAGEANAILPAPRPSKLRRFLFRSRDEDQERTCELPIGRMLLLASTRGRVFPIKAWDQDYFNVLLRSKFVLCPNGDYVWSYRFFEAIMCGAIPIVEQDCPAYAGFRFYTMSSLALEWSNTTAEHNYNLCLRSLTIGPQELNAEIASLLKTHPVRS